MQQRAAITILKYDGLGWRISKEITTSADWDATHHYYYSGQQMIETRNGSDQTLKQHVWGVTYVDELLQVGINQDPENADTCDPAGDYENVCERFFWACQDANFNVLGILSATGDLVERYEYTPYGQRTVYSRGWLLCDATDDGSVDVSDAFVYSDDMYPNSKPASRADFNGDGLVTPSDGFIWNYNKFTTIADDPLVMHPRLESFRNTQYPELGSVTTSICDIGHQGLMHDKEFGLIYNRARYLQPVFGRFMQRDLEGYLDGMSLYEAVRGNPIVFVDPAGMGALTLTQMKTEIREALAYAENMRLKLVRALEDRLPYTPISTNDNVKEAVDNWLHAIAYKKWWESRWSHSCSAKQEAAHARGGEMLAWKATHNKLSPDEFEERLSSMTSVIDTLMGMQAAASAVDRPLELVSKAGIAATGTKPPAWGFGIAAVPDPTWPIIAAKTGIVPPGPTVLPGLSALPYLAPLTAEALRRVTRLGSDPADPHGGWSYNVWVLVRCYECKCADRDFKAGSIRKSFNLREFTLEEPVLTNFDKHDLTKSRMNILRARGDAGIVLEREVPKLIRKVCKQKGKAWIGK